MPIGRKKNAQLVSTAVASGARQDNACDVIGFSTRTLQRWRIEGSIGEEKRPTPIRLASGNKLSKAEMQAVIDVCNREEFASLPPSEIVPILADRGEYTASESSFYRVLHAENMLHHRGKAKPRNIHKKPTSYIARVQRLGREMLEERLSAAFR
jgi:putative transposase